ncbi:hypothetical protein [Gabonibacter chumensis]|uniref:hypothetical protein n=1 Tax=Gabonibacter chumensis TaxID=2972474 RepID=UPI00257294E9|nr:hypothetical protein [Gabonibacter chumensis]MCR9011409.1 hypothetical protein [Gabonibacter chumensis]
MKTAIKTIGILLMICALLVILSAGSKQQYKVSQLRGKWQMETESPRPDQIIREFFGGFYTNTRLVNNDTILQAKYWFYLSDSIVTTFDERKLYDRTSGEYIISQYGENSYPPYEFPCSVFKIISLNKDSLVIKYVPKKGQVMIGSEAVTYKRIK